MRKKLWGFLAFASAIGSVLPAQAQDWRQAAAHIRMRSETGKPAFVRLKDGFQPAVSSANTLLSEVLGMRVEDQWVLQGTDRDQQGYLHYRFGQAYHQIPVEFAHYYVHSQSGKVQSMNGHYIPVQSAVVPLITRDAAFQAAQAAIGGQVWMWEIPSEEALLKAETGDLAATWRPTGELVVAPQNTQFLAKDYRLAWKFDLYSVQPLKREHVYVDALSGDVIFRNPKLMHADSAGVAQTKYSGTQAIVADFTGTDFRLRETGRGGGVQTLNLNRGFNYGGATDFLDTDNDWNNVNAFADEAATDAHWGAEMTFDYYWTRFGRNSYNNSGAVMRSYVHYDQNYQNAFWDGSRMTYGDGANGNRPFCALDVCGHEFSHGVVEYTANLVYQDQPGALNESYADIFGTSIEFFARPSSSNWLIGEHIGAFRSMADPKQFSNPDTYEGSYWVAAGGFDNGGVHYNSGVQNHWYYLLSVGGSGTNDNGDSYSVTGIGIDSAATIAYRCLSVYLGPTSQYEDAAFYSIESAKDLFGACSPEMIATMDAWYAVGVGRPYGPVSAQFAVNETSHCTAPAVVSFENLSVGGLSYTWAFGDGTYSTDWNPVHTYSFFGTYQPMLIVEGCTGNDTFLLPTPVVIDQNLPCTTVLPQGSGLTLTTCGGRILDSGGNGDYLANSNGQIVMTAPSGVVSLTFNSFHFATAGDYIALYDGATTAAPLIGYFNGSSLPNGGTITSTGSSLLLIERTNSVLQFPGFDATWSCVVGVEDAVSLNSLSVWPNPTNGSLHIAFPQTTSSDASLQLLDAMGRTIRTEVGLAHLAGQAEWELSGLPAGIYFLAFSDGGNKQVQRIVLQ